MNKVKMLNSITIFVISICILFDLILNEISVFPYVWVGLNYIIFRAMIKLMENNDE